MYLRNPGNDDEAEILNISIFKIDKKIFTRGENKEEAAAVCDIGHVIMSA